MKYYTVSTLCLLMDPLMCTHYNTQKNHFTLHFVSISTGITFLGQLIKCKCMYRQNFIRILLVAVSFCSCYSQIRSKKNRKSKRQKCALCYFPDTNDNEFLLACSTSVILWMPAASGAFKWLNYSDHLEGAVIICNIFSHIRRRCVLLITGNARKTWSAILGRWPM